MKKVLIIDPFGVGGVSYYTYSLFTTLLSKGYPAELLVPGTYDAVPGPEKHILKVLFGMDRRMPKMLRVLVVFLNPFIINYHALSGKISILHFQSSLVPVADLLCIIIAKMFRKKIVYTVHEVSYTQSLNLQNNLLSKVIDASLKQIYHLADFLFIHSEIAEKELVARFHVNTGKIGQVEHGLQDFHNQLPALTKEQARKELNLQENCMIGLYFGDLRHSKGIDLMLNAMPAAFKELPDFFLLVAGKLHSTFSASDLESFTGNLKNYRDRFIIHSEFIPSNKVACYFSACDFVILPYRFIYQSGVLATAYAFGKPVIASRIPGLENHVVEGLTGILINDPEKPQEIVTSIIRMSHSGLMSNVARQRILEYGLSRYSWETVSNKTIECYNKFK